MYLFKKKKKRMFLFVWFFKKKKKDAGCYGQVNLENATLNKATPG